MLVDGHGRTVNYLRLAVTDRCNLRCSYCMPACGIDFVQRADLLSYEEYFRILKILSAEGVDKLRITGGEPFVRRGIMEFIEEVHQMKWFKTINLTTNATLTGPYTQRIADAGIHTVNVSLDTLNRDRFLQITRRDELPAVMEAMKKMMEAGIRIKLNMVVMKGVNDDELVAMAGLAEKQPISVRFLEEMPFNGVGASASRTLNHLDILQTLQASLGNLVPLPGSPGETSTNYSIPGFKGNIGIIASFSRTFCGTCNRLRITPTGMVKSCLYDAPTLNIRDLMRSTTDDSAILKAIRQELAGKAVNGFEAEARRHSSIDESMATIGG